MDSGSRSSFETSYSSEGRQTEVSVCFHFVGKQVKSWLLEGKEEGALVFSKAIE